MDAPTVNQTSHRGIFTVDTTSARGLRSALERTGGWVAFADPVLEARLESRIGPKPPVPERIRAAAQSAGVAPLAVMLAQLSILDETADVRDIALPPEVLRLGITPADVADTPLPPMLLVGRPEQCDAVIALAENIPGSCAS